MAINRIEVDTRMLKSTISDMNSDLKTIRNYADQIYSEIKELDAMWDGRANMVFNQQFEIDRQTLLNICNSIENYIDSLEYAKKQYDNCENEVLNMVNAIRI